jgi:hypothetical protein
VTTTFFPSNRQNLGVTNSYGDSGVWAQPSASGTTFPFGSSHHGSASTHALAPDGGGGGNSSSSSGGGGAGDAGVVGASGGGSGEGGYTQFPSACGISHGAGVHETFNVRPPPSGGMRK